MVIKIPAPVLRSPVLRAQARITHQLLRLPAPRRVQVRLPVLARGLIQLPILLQLQLPVPVPVPILDSNMILIGVE